MELTHRFNASAVDYFGYVNPRALMQEINEGVVAGNYADGVGFSHIFPKIGVTWMMGQCVLEFDEFVPCGEEVTIRSGGHEQFGVSTVRRCSMLYEGREVVRFSAKLLPVDFKQRKTVSPAVLEPFWRSAPDPCGEPISFLEMPEDMEVVEEFRVRYRDCDSNRHMTAFRYLDLVLESIGYWNEEPHLPKRIQIDYKRECLPGDRLQLRHTMVDGGHYCAGIKEDGTVSFLASAVLAQESSPRAEILRV